MVGYRLIRNQSLLTPRSSCPECHGIIAWYDTIPILSWCLLKARCRNCSKPISFLYPCIEILTALLFSLLCITMPLHYFFSYCIFFSALIVTIRSDIETMLISRYVTIALVPIGFFLSTYHALPLSFTDSFIGAITGYLFLFITNTIFKYIRGIDGIGEGDFDLLMLIGSFTGIIGCWTSITLGSLLGSFYALCAMLFHYCSPIKFDHPLTTTTKIPFGPFLAIGAIIFVFVQKYIFHFFLA